MIGDLLNLQLMQRVSKQSQRLGAPALKKNSQSPAQTPAKSQHPKQVVRLTHPKIVQQNALRFTAGTRPYREAGIRMEKEVVSGKIIYHNYGHGGGGLSVGYGCVWQLLQKEFLSQNVPKTEPIAVLGAGIIGLTTAYLLSDNGFKVNLYADIYPFINEQGKPELTSTVAAGYWMPLKLGNKQQTKAVAKLTWDHYHEVMALQQQTGRKLGVSKIPTYCVNDDEGLTYFEIDGVIEPKKIKVCFQNEVPVEAVTFPSLVIESSKYLPFLIEKMQVSGKVQFYRQLVTKQSLLKKKERHVFNCCGLNGADLFGDNSESKGIKGHVWHFNLNQQGAAKDYILFLKTSQGRWILQVPHQQSNKFVLGISYEQGKTDSLPEYEEALKTIKTASKFYLSMAPKPGKQAASL